MKRIIKLTAVMTLVLLGMLRPSFETCSSSADTISVGDDYPIIQAAINAANPGDTVYIHNGTYFENVIVNKSLTLIGESRDATIVDGSGIGNVVKITADNVTLTNLTVMNGGIGSSDCCILLFEVQNCNISQTNAANSRYGIWCVESYECDIAENNVSSNFYGVELTASSYISLTGNVVANNSHGVVLENSCHNTLRNNVMLDNAYNFRVESSELLWFINDVDTSNTVEDKPIFYLMNQRNITIDAYTHPNTGYLAVINSTKITIQNLTIEKSGQGILLGYTTDSIVQNCTVTGSYYGIMLAFSSNNRIRENKLSSNLCGIMLNWISNNNNVAKNSIENNTDGIQVVSYNNTLIENNVINNHRGFRLHLTSNTVVGNNIAYNYIGACFVASSDNKLFHNNFVENQRQVYIWTESGYCFNIWDDGYPSGGNFWSNYDGEDADFDGIGDVAYVIDPLNKDEFPLAGRFNIFNASLQDETSYNISITSNSTLSNFQFNSQDRMISFDVEGEAGTTGFCRVAVPLNFMWCDDPDEWVVTVADHSVQPYIIERNNCTYIYVNYTHCKKTVEIQSSHIISEFPSKIIMPLIMIATLLIITTRHCKSIRNE